MTKSIASPVKPCLGCARPIRPAHRSIEEFPGTLVHTGRGICGKCRDRGVRGEIKDAKVRGERLAIEENKRNLDAFLRRISADHQKLERRQKIRMVIR